MHPESSTTGTLCNLLGNKFIFPFAVQSTPINLQKSDIPLVSAADCQNIWGSVIEITNRIQCVGGNGVVSVCSVSNSFQNRNL